MQKMPGGFRAGFSAVLLAGEFAVWAADAAVPCIESVWRVGLARGTGLRREGKGGNDGAVALHNEVRTHAQFPLYAAHDPAAFSGFHAMVEGEQFLPPGEAHFGPTNFLGTDGYEQIGRAQILGCRSGLDFHDHRFASIHFNGRARGEFLPRIGHPIEPATQQEMLVQSQLTQRIVHTSDSDVANAQAIFLHGGGNADAHRGQRRGELLGQFLRGLFGSLNIDLDRGRGWRCGRLGGAQRAHREQQDQQGNLSCGLHRIS